MEYLKYVENVIPLSKLIGLLFLFCLPLLSILFLKTKRNDLAHPVMGTIFLVTWVCVKFTRYFTSSVSIVRSRIQVEIQSTNEMTPYFIMTKCNKLFITYLTCSTEHLPTLPSIISIISFSVVKTTLFNKHALCSMNYNLLSLG